MSRACSAARGFTLVEFTIVAAIGGLIVLSLSTFYLNAQSMWLDSSVQAVTQRDATLFMEQMERVIGSADQVVVNDPSHLSLLRNDVQTAEIDWDSSKTHATVRTGMNDANAPEVTSTWPATGTLKALQFRIEGSAPNARVVYLDSLRIETAAGESIYMSTCFALYNKP
jgi:prepilin-type N-terminal cleavage/methylation domain-containing protein